MGNIGLSIVIPVYNLEQYIEQCVRSIFPVERTNVEVILVDDGSTDRSGYLCDTLARVYPEVRVIHKKNGGAADTRNVGMKAAKADYIMFIDGDDFLAPHAVDTVMCHLKSKPQVLTFDYYEYYGESDIRMMCHINAESLTNSLGQVSRDVFSKVSPLPMPWLYVVSREYIEGYNIYMHPGLLDEDEEWTARLFASVSSVEILHEPIYFYRRNRENSLTFNRKKENTLADIKIIQLLQSEISSEKYSSAGQYVLENKCRQMVNKVMDDLLDHLKQDNKSIRNEVNQYRFLLKDGTTLDKMHFYLDPICGRKRVAGLARILTNLRNRR